MVDDIEDLQKEFQAEREALLHDIRSLQAEMRLQQGIINCFVPPEEAAVGPQAGEGQTNLGLNVLAQSSHSVCCYCTHGRPQRIRSLASWDELQGDWVIPNSHLAGNGMYAE